MKKSLLFLLQIVLYMGSASLLSADEEYAFEIRASEFFPQSHRVKTIYDNHMKNFDFVISKWVDEEWDLYVGAGFMHKMGRSRGADNRTSLTYFPFTAGMRYFMPIFSQLDFYLGAGVLVGYLRMDDHSRYIKHKQSSRGAWGGVANSGFRFYLFENLFFDIFADYQYQKFCFDHSSRNIRRNDLMMSGFRCGLGVGFAM